MDDQKSNQWQKVERQRLPANPDPVFDIFVLLSRVKVLREYEIVKCAKKVSSIENEEYYHEDYFLSFERI